MRALIIFYLIFFGFTGGFGKSQADSLAVPSSVVAVEGNDRTFEGKPVPGAQLFRNKIFPFAYSFILLTMGGLFIFITVRHRKKEKSNREVLERKNLEISRARDQLVNQEKLALLGKLTWGIAHEIKTPLNFINNFSKNSLELTRELARELDMQISESDASFGQVRQIIEDLCKNSITITRNGRRMDRLVSSLLPPPNYSPGKPQMIDLHHLIDDNVKLAFHSYRAIDPTFNLQIQKEYDRSLELVWVIPQALSRVMLNIAINACYALNQKRRKTFSVPFRPTLNIATRNLDGKFEISIRDNGPGIPEEIQPEIFSPFFSTKPLEDGNIGLGLFISHDIIVRGHKGAIAVKSHPEEFTSFIIHLPMYQPDPVLGEDYSPHW